jgi:uncharacterized membrane protein
MLTKIKQRISLSNINLNLRHLNEPGAVLLGYLALAGVQALGNGHIPHAGLAIILAILGSGCSTVAVLFPYPNELDIVERLTLSACLSIAIGGMFGLSLAHSPWGLRLWPFLIMSGSYNLGCLILTLYRRRNLEKEELTIRLECKKLLGFWKTDLSGQDSLITIVLIIFLLSGSLVLTQNMHQSSMDPPMTEFYLLGKGGYTEEYLNGGRPGELLSIPYGIRNRENAPASYQVKAVIQGNEAGITQTILLNANEAYRGQIEFNLLDITPGQTKVEFVLYCDGKPYRFLHIWINVTDT